MDITLDFRSKQTICEQVQNSLRQKIREKRLLPGDQLPAVRDLASVLKINFNTVARAYRELDREGWISTQQGRGTYVIENLSEPGVEKEEPTEQPVEEKIEELIDRFLSEVQSFDISDEQLWNALEQRKARLRGLAARPTRRLVGRRSNKPFHHPWMLEWSAGSGRVKRIPKRQANL